MEISAIFSSILRNKATSLLIVIQVAFTYAIVNSSVLETLTIMENWRTPTGIDQEDLIAVYPLVFDDRLNVGQAVEADLREIAAMPGIVNITPVSAFPFQGGGEPLYRGTGDAAEQHWGRIYNTNLNGPEVLGIELVAGRLFSENEVIQGDSQTLSTQPAVALISEDMATAMFPDQAALGQAIRTDPNGQPMEVIGIYRNIISGESLINFGAPYNTVIRPYFTWSDGRLPNYLIRAEPGQAESLIEDVREQLMKIDGRYLLRLEVLTGGQKRMYDGRGSHSVTILGISSIGILVTALGIAGLVFFLIAQRRRQIGIRRALGARRRDIIRYYLFEISILAWVGLIVGAVVFLTLNYSLVSASFVERTINVQYMLVVTMLIWGVCLLATWIPCWRAANVDPAGVSRYA